jgi:site-specific DNA recombinase
LYDGQHEPLISRDLFERVQRVFVAANHPPHGTKRQHSFVGLLKCGRCGCSYTAEIKKGLYVYYHCTGAKGACGNSYIREEGLALLFGELVKRVRIPSELADAVAKVLRESQSDKETFVRTATMRLQQQQLAIRAKLDRAYDDRLSSRIPEDLWTSKSAELEGELRRVRAEMA